MADIITVVDARMGRGKSSAAIRYMNRYRGVKKFLYITPFLNEVNRICEQCDFDQSDSDYMSKSAELKALLKSGKNVAATHSLFYLMDDEALDIVKSYNYSLIIDESINVISRLDVSIRDFNLVVEQLSEEGENGRLQWKDKMYSGRFSDYKEMADRGFLYKLDSALLCIMNPQLLHSFDEVFMLTYLFDGQYQKAYLEYFGFKYRIIGVQKDDAGYYFSDSPDSPPAIDFQNLINIDASRSNSVGNDKYSLSKNWFASRGYEDPEMKRLRNGLKNFFSKNQDGRFDTRLWTCFKDSRNKLIDTRTGRFRNNFLQVGARATNEYRECTDLAYMVNRFIDPNLMKFFSDKNINIDADLFALSEMLQWVWRGAIRDDKPINLYIPSKRMRTLLINWMEKERKGR